MKYVCKQTSPESFELWKAKANEDWHPTYADLRNPEKADLQEHLLAEQGWVCCYCGRRITEGDSHIEHFRPQERYVEQALQYENLHASCIRATNPGSPLHCGHAKENQFDEQRMLSPLQSDCEIHFSYALDGQIILVGDETTYTRDLLKLDIAFLCNRRQEQLSRVFDVAFLESADDDELLRLQEAFQLRDEGGKLPDFGHVVARFAKQLMTP